MPIQVSGKIDFASLAVEYGLSNTNISFANFYRDGSIVPNVVTNASIPTSGTINLNQFYGATT